MGALEVQSGPALPGDYNQNGVVDAADYSVWRRHLGTLFALPNEDPGVTPGQVTAEDYQVWRANFGKTVPMSSATARAAALTSWDAAEPTDPPADSTSQQPIDLRAIGPLPFGRSELRRKGPIARQPDSSSYAPWTDLALLLLLEDPGDAPNSPIDKRATEADVEQVSEAADFVFAALDVALTG